MRLEGNPLDLNILPEEYGKQAFEESSTTIAASKDTTKFKKKKSGGKEGEEDCGKVYECRFCSLKFCKSQALGGHMNRHRQERETETLNRARQLVFSNDNHAGASAQMGFRDLNFAGSQHITHGSLPQRGGVADQSLQFRPVIPRLPTQTPPPPPFHPYIYPHSSSHPRPYPPPCPPRTSTSDYFIGHVLPANSQRQLHSPNYTADTNYRRFGAPLAHSFPTEGVQAPVARDGTTSNQEDVRSWNCSYTHGQHLDPS